MPGPISDSLDPEWGTGSKADEIDDALEEIYDRLTGLLHGAPPMDVRKLVKAKGMSRLIGAALTEKQWRLLRFSVERARESL
jgi:hypothetical protein